MRAEPPPIQTSGVDLPLDRPLSIRAQCRADRADPLIRRRRHMILSPLVRRILAVNLIAPVLLFVAFVYLDTYEETLTASAFQALKTEGELIAAAVGEGAINLEVSIEGPVVRARHGINDEMAGQMIRRLSDLAQVRARLFATNGEMVADSRRLLSFGGMVQVQDLPPLEPREGLAGLTRSLYDAFFRRTPAELALPSYQEQLHQKAADYDEVLLALSNGVPATAMRSRPTPGPLLFVAVPVQYYKQVVGAVLVSRGGESIETALFEMRLAILEIFILVLGLTTLLSLYMGGTIARPIMRLAVAADGIRNSRTSGRNGVEGMMGAAEGGIDAGSKTKAKVRATLPDLSHRGDEVGDLSRAMREMTEALWARMDAIERFAADVSHEIKNPLTSLRSAVETAARIDDPDRRNRLMAVILDDVGRLDRLISDISDASRLDAELSRAVPSPVDMAPMIAMLAEIHTVQAEADLPADGTQPVTFIVDVPRGDSLTVQGLEDRLVQVLRNLITNALSFSPPGGCIRLHAERQGAMVRVTVEDDGPGLPEGTEESIFSRFYSERPAGEKFGTHSGLGLSISRQIIETHGGSIRAENRMVARSDGSREVIVGGARFIIDLPEAGSGS